MIRYLGLGWTEAYHSYSKAGYTYTPADLMEHFVETVLPIAVNNTVPNEAPLELPGLPKQLVKVTLVTKSNDCIALDKSEAKEDEDFRIAPISKRGKLKDSGCGDEIQELEQVLWPVDRIRQYTQQEKMFIVDMLFEQTDQETKEIFRVWSQG